MTGLFNPMTTIGKMVKPFEHPYKGIVVQVDSDPEYIGRIKVNIPELYGEYLENESGSTAGILPWIYPRYFGKFSGKIDFSVPEVGEVVEVDFPYKNPYLGYYTNKPMSNTIWDSILAIDSEEGQAIVDKFKQHYPNVYGSIDSNLTGWYVDKLTNEVFLVQGGKKASITLDSEGSIIVTSPKNIVFTAGENIEFNAGTLFKVVSPDETHTIDNDINITATTIKSTAKVEQTGDVNVTGSIIATVEVQAKTIQLTTHTHAVPQSPEGTNESRPPTP